MWKFLIRRTLIMTPQVILLSVLIFVLAKLMPGDALTGLMEPDIDPKRLDELREQLGLNDTWHVQYYDWIRGIVIEWAFGQSFRFKVSVTKVIGERLLNSVCFSHLS